MNVFISHISEEAHIAKVLKEWIESSFLGQCDVFVSSDKEDIPAGSKWLDQIDTALECYYSIYVFFILFVEEVITLLNIYDNLLKLIIK